MDKTIVAPRERTKRDATAYHSGTTRLASHAAGMEAARTRAHGLQILTVDRMAARLAGGFLQPIDAEALQDAVARALNSIEIGELEDMKKLPGMVRAAVSTLEKVWHARIDLAAHPDEPRLKALSAMGPKTCFSVLNTSKSELNQFSRPFH